MEKTYKEKKIEALRQLIETDSITADELFPAAVPVPVEPVWVIEEFVMPDGTPGFNRYKRIPGKDDYTKGDGKGKLGSTQNHMLNAGEETMYASVKKRNLQIHSVRADKNYPVIAIGDWITAECTHMGNTLMQIEGFVVNDRNNLLVKTRQFRKHGVGIENCRKVDAPVEKKQNPVAKVGEYVIADDHADVPDKAVRVTEVIDYGTYYKYLYPDGHSNGCSVSWCRIATQQEIDRDWKKPVEEEKVEPLIQVLLTSKQMGYYGAGTLCQAWRDAIGDYIVVNRDASGFYMTEIGDSGKNHYIVSCRMAKAIKSAFPDVTVYGIGQDDHDTLNWRVIQEQLQRYYTGSRENDK
jgi:hypothetical protein